MVEPCPSMPLIFLILYLYAERGSGLTRGLDRTTPSNPADWVETVSVLLEPGDSSFSLAQAHTAPLGDKSVQCQPPFQTLGMV